MKEPDKIDATVHFVAGKGGVGKSLLARSLSKFFVAKGFKTLHVELSEDESLEGMREVSPEKLGANYYYLKIFSDQATYQYLSLKIPSKKILDAILSKRLFRALCAAMPGISDLTRLGKIWYHASGAFGASKEETFTRIVVDLPSSGFVRRFLSVARIVFKAVKMGPLAKEAELIHKYFKDPKNALLHLVTVPQELIINETCELYQEMKDSPDITLGSLFINRFIDLEEECKELLPLVPANEPGIKEIFDFLFLELQKQKKEILKLDALFMPQIKILEQWGEVSEEKIISDIARGCEAS